MLGEMGYGVWVGGRWEMERAQKTQARQKTTKTAKNHKPDKNHKDSNLKENEQMKKLCRYSIIDKNKPKEKHARLGETWNHKSRMTVCAISWRMP